MNLRDLTATCAVLCLLAGVALAQNDEDLEPGEVIPPAEAPTWLEGRGENELVLIHGLGGSTEVWSEVTPYLSGSFDVHAYELHGHGATRPLPEPTIAAEVAALRDWIEARDLVYPALVGHGLGGMVAMQYAFEYPADVKRLVVIDTAPRQIAAEQYKDEVADQLVNDYDRWVASHFVSISLDRAICDQAVDWALRTDAATFTGLLLSSFDWDLTEQLPRQTVPMLVIGSAAFLPEPGNEQAWLEHYGYASARVLSFKRVDDSGHYMMLEKPAYLASVLLVYLRADQYR